MNKKDCKKGNRNNYTMNAYNMVDNNFPNDNVIIIGDLNDKLDDSVDNNVFQNFIQDNTNYQFVDINIALGESTNYSWPGWNQNTYPPTHLDHIIITNEIFHGSNLLLLSSFCFLLFRVNM